MIAQVFYVAIVIVVVFNLLFRLPLSIERKRDRNQGGRLMALASFHICFLVSGAQRIAEGTNFTGGLPFGLLGAVLSTVFLSRRGTKR